VELDRRKVLQAGGVVAAAGVLAACGSAGEASPDSVPAASGSDDAGDAAAGGTAGAFAQTSDIPVGGGVISAEPAIVVTQPTEGDFKAFTAICPHQGCLVSEVVDNEIVCPCHGSRFSGTDGSVLAGPARQGLMSAGIAVDGGAVVLS